MDASPEHRRHRTHGGHLIEGARLLAGELLKGLDERWTHTEGVAERAGELADLVHPGERTILLAAAWVHDIGYSPKVQVSGFHPLDGARYLDQLGARPGWPARLSRLVAHHSGARFVAEVR